MATIPAINSIPSIGTPLVDQNGNMSATWHEYFRKFINSTVQVENTNTTVVNAVTPGAGLKLDAQSTASNIILDVSAGPGLVANAANVTVDITDLFAVQAANAQEIMISDPTSNNIIRKTTLNSVAGLSSTTILGTANQITSTLNPSTKIVTLSLPNNVVFPGTYIQLPDTTLPGASTSGRLMINSANGKLSMDNSSSWLPYGTCPATNTSRAIPVFTGTNNCNFVDSTVTIDASANIVTTGTITATNITGIVSYVAAAGTTQALAVNTGYICTNASQCNGTLPATAAIGSVVKMVSKGAGGIKMTANTGQTINGLGTATSSAGSITCAAQYDSLAVVCVVANTTWAIEYASSTLLTFA
jgi:hypothetical protein